MHVATLSIEPVWLRDGGVPTATGNPTPPLDHPTRFHAGWLRRDYDERPRRRPIIARATDQETMELRLSDVLSGLSHALDVTEGHPAGHAERSCLLGMRIAERAGLPADQRAALYYALLLKDAGCSVNAAPIAALYGHDDAEVKATRRQHDHRRAATSALHTLRYAAPRASLQTRLGRIRALVASGAAGAAELTQLRCERGATIALGIGLDEETAAAIRSLDEHWDGGGYPAGLTGEAIPIAARVICLAQTLELFWQTGGPAAAVRMARRRRGRWFDPALVDVVTAAADDPAFWQDLEHPDVRSAEPREATVIADEARLDAVADAFGQIVDAKSPYTASHSKGVAELAALVAIQLGGDDEHAGRLYRAGQLHDLGKLAIPNTILDKRGPLDDAEWSAMRRHPQLGHDILRRVPPFADMARLALTHHERLDGSGYPFAMTDARLGIDDRILAVADVAEALSADRPYRDSLSADEVLRIMSQDRGTKLDARCLDALEVLLPQWREAAAGAPSGAPTGASTERRAA